MLNLFSIFQNFFNTKEISDDNLKKFSQDHIQRITVNNGSGLFTIILNEMVAAYTAYFGNITEEDLAFAVQQSLTMSTDNLLQTFKDTVSRKEGIIKDTYGKGSPTYQEFFPLGVDEYHQANKSNVETLMSRMVSSATAHIADLGLPFVNLFRDIKDNYTIARNLQLAKKGEVSTERVETGTTRDVVEVQVCKNIHFIGYTFPGNDAECMKFFDQSIIRPSQSSDSDGIGRAAGIITHETTGAVLADVVVDYVGLFTPSKKSKSDGTYKAANAPLGAQRVRFVKPGFISLEVPIIIGDVGDTPLNITLRPE
ncbi:MAG TPA: carboxypeptidase-like regulatory domain-containing protein [Bacteroidia bacterium]|nr:carboxypeptidase-like regulatory domain-containing protein [Bacteroidia bacterium]